MSSLHGIIKIDFRMPQVNYSFEIKRNVTIISDDSGTGKSYFCSGLEEYLNEIAANRISGATLAVSQPVALRVLTPGIWNVMSKDKPVQDTIFFIDEAVGSFYFSKPFANFIKISGCYFVIFARDQLLPELSVNEIYGLHYDSSTNTNVLVSRSDYDRLGHKIL